MYAILLPYAQSWFRVSAKCESCFWQRLLITDLVFFPFWRFLDNFEFANKLPKCPASQFFEHSASWNSHASDNISETAEVAVVPAISLAAPLATAQLAAQLVIHRN